MSNALQNTFNLAARVLMAALFLPAGIGKLTGFEGTVGYIASVGLPLPTVGAALALVVEIVGSLALLAGFGTRIAALVLAAFTLGGQLLLPRLLGCACRPGFRGATAVLQEHGGGRRFVGNSRQWRRSMESGRAPRLNPRQAMD